MKLKAEIIGVETNGSFLVVACQTEEVAGSQWQDMQRMTLRIRDSARTRTAFHVGRILDMVIKPRER